jgi:hypothetical protein
MHQESRFKAASTFYKEKGNSDLTTGSYQICLRRRQENPDALRPALRMVYEEEKY